MQKGLIVPVVTCKGRLQHLAKTLPVLREQFEQIVVVDYSCPDRCGVFAATVPGVSVELVTGKEHFHKTHALNIGARSAIDGGATRLLFIDADTIIRPRLRELVESIPLHSMGITGPKEFAHTSLLGFLLVSVGGYMAVNGFDERYIGWGYEDQDMRLRLYCDAGCKPYHIPESYFESIVHDNTLRGEFQLGDLKESARRNQRLYRDALRARLDHWSTELKECLPYK